MFYEGLNALKAAVPAKLVQFIERVDNQPLLLDGHTINYPLLGPLFQRLGWEIAQHDVIYAAYGTSHCRCFGRELYHVALNHSSLLIELTTMISGTFGDSWVVDL
jgi:hypothetical protein